MLLWHRQHRKRAYSTKAILLCGDALGRDRCRGRRPLPATNRRKVIVATDPPALPSPPRCSGSEVLAAPPELFACEGCARFRARLSRGILSYGVATAFPHRKQPRGED